MNFSEALDELNKVLQEDYTVNGKTYQFGTDSIDYDWRDCIEYIGATIWANDTDISFVYEATYDPGSADVDYETDYGIGSYEYWGGSFSDDRNDRYATSATIDARYIDINILDDSFYIGDNENNKVSKEEALKLIGFTEADLEAIKPMLAKDAKQYVDSTLENHLSDFFDED